MAVDAQYHHLFSPQLYKNSMNTIRNNPTFIYGAAGQPGLAGASAMSAAAPTTVTTEIGGVFGANSNNSNHVSDNNHLLKKRSRDNSLSLTFLGEDVSSQVYSHMLDVDGLIVQHVMNARTELSLKRRRFSSQVIAALNESLSKQLRSKDEEIEQLRGLNWAMEERIKSLSVESNAWRYLAQTHEAAAATLRANLEQVLADQAVAVADDAESCCGGDNFLSQEAAGDWKSVCRNCGNGEPSVLLLPCRHLCLCSTCGPAIHACPICKCSRTGSVNVNLS